MYWRSLYESRTFIYLRWISKLLCFDGLSNFNVWNIYVRNFEFFMFVTLYKRLGFIYAYVVRFDIDERFGSVSNKIFFFILRFGAVLASNRTKPRTSLVFNAYCNVDFNVFFFLHFINKFFKNANKGYITYVDFVHNFWILIGWLVHRVRTSVVQSSVSRLKRYDCDTLIPLINPPLRWTPPNNSSLLSL